MTQHLFVYGTLRSGSGHPMQAFLAKYATLVGDGWVAGRLYDLGLFPGAVPDLGGRVTGELYLLQTVDILEQLDRYEGCGPDDVEPHLFHRALVEVHGVEGRTIVAWIYWYDGSVSGASIVSEGH